MNSRYFEQKLRDPLIREWLRVLTPVEGIVRNSALAFFPMIELMTGSRISALRLLCLLGHAIRSDTLGERRKL